MKAENEILRTVTILVISNVIASYLVKKIEQSNQVES